MAEAHLSEEDIRRIVREELVAALTVAIDRQRYGGELRVNGVPVHGA